MLKDYFIGILNIFYSDHPFMMMLNDIRKFTASIWNYSIYTTLDKQNIFIGNVVIAIILFIFGFKLARRLSKQVKKKLPPTLDKSTVVTLERLSYYFFLIVITFFVLEIAKVPLTIFTVVGTTLALGIGLGSQNMANNFISGLIILVERPIKLGDIIEVKNIIGRVTNIGARCISIKTPENIIMLIPNSHILQDIVINWTHEDCMLKVGLVYTVTRQKNGVEKFEKIALEVLSKNESVIKDPAPKVILRAISKETHIIEVEFWLHIESSEQTKYIFGELNRSFDNAFEKNEIQIIEQHEQRRATVQKD